jgi:hypothetical protein
MPLNIDDTPTTRSLTRKQVERILIEETIDLMLVDEPSLSRAELRKFIRRHEAFGRNGHLGTARRIHPRRLTKSELERELDLLPSVQRALAIIRQRLMAELILRQRRGDEASS